MTRWTPEQLRGHGRRWKDVARTTGAHSYDELVSICNQAADDAEALATVTVSRDMFADGLDKVIDTLGEDYLLDQPDGGCVYPWEGVSRLKAENERLKSKLDAVCVIGDAEAECAEINRRALNALRRRIQQYKTQRDEARADVERLKAELIAANQRTDEARAIARRLHAALYPIPECEIGHLADAATIAGWASPSKSVVK